MPEYKNIEDIKQKLNSLNRSKAVKRAADLIDPEDLKMVQKVISITDKYSDSDWASKSFLDVQTDLITLQSLLVSMAAKFGDIMSNHESESSAVTNARSKIRLDAKAAKKELEKDGDIVKVTVEDIKDLSYVLTEDAQEASEDVKVIGNYLRFIYFAVKDQVQLLEKAATRFHYNGERK